MPPRRVNMRPNVSRRFIKWAFVHAHERMSNGCESQALQDVIRHRRCLGPSEMPSAARTRAPPSPARPPGLESGRCRTGRTLPRSSTRRGPARCRFAPPDPSTRPATRPSPVGGGAAARGALAWTRRPRRSGRRATAGWPPPASGRAGRGVNSYWWRRNRRQKTGERTSCLPLATLASNTAAAMSWRAIRFGVNTRSSASNKPPPMSGKWFAMSEALSTFNVQNENKAVSC